MSGVLEADFQSKLIDALERVGAYVWNSSGTQYSKVVVDLSVNIGSACVSRMCANEAGLYAGSLAYGFTGWVELKRWNGTATGGQMKFLKNVIRNDVPGFIMWFAHETYGDDGPKRWRDSVWPVEIAAPRVKPRMVGESSLIPLGKYDLRMNARSIYWCLSVATRRLMHEIDRPLLIRGCADWTG